jgi:hypothetical protein
LLLRSTIEEIVHERTQRGKVRYAASSLRTLREKNVLQGHEQSGGKPRRDSGSFSKIGETQKGRNVAP